MTLLHVLRCFTFYLEVKQLKPVAVLLLSLFLLAEIYQIDWRCHDASDAEGLMAIWQAHESWPTSIISGPLPHQEPELTPEDKALLWDPPVLEPRCCDSRYLIPLAGLMRTSGRICMTLYAEFRQHFWISWASSSSHSCGVSQGPAVKDVVSKVWLLSHLWLIINFLSVAIYWVHLGANAPDLDKLHLTSYCWVVFISHDVSLYPIITVPIIWLL